MNELDDASRIDSFLRNAGEVLRLLASIIQPLRAGGSVPPLTLEVQTDFSSELERCLEALSAALLGADREGDGPSLHRIHERIVLILRLVQFHAGFPSKELRPPSMATRTGLLARLLAVGLAQNLTFRGRF